MAHRKAFLRMPDMEESEAVFLRKGPKSGFGPDFYFGPCGLEGQSDRTKHSAVIFQPPAARHLFGGSRWLPHHHTSSSLGGRRFNSHPTLGSPRRSPHTVRSPYRTRTAILPGIYLNPFDFRSYAWSGPVSTEVGNHLGTLGAVRFLHALKKSFWGT